MRMSVKKRRVAELAAVGATVPEISCALEVTPATVRSYLRQIYEKLGVSTRLELAERVRASVRPKARLARS
jgi:DNA-binding CsgD family transcriptional regulator